MNEGGKERRGSASEMLPKGTRAVKETGKERRGGASEMLPKGSRAVKETGKEQRSGASEMPMPSMSTAETKDEMPRPNMEAGTSGPSIPQASPSGQMPIPSFVASDVVPIEPPRPSLPSSVPSDVASTGSPQASYAPGGPEMLTPQGEIRVSQLNSLLKAAKAGWVAGPTPASKLPAEQRKRLLGYTPGPG